MVRIIRGLFGSNKSNQEREPEKKPKPQNKKEAYYLEPDDARTFGDMELYRKGADVKKQIDNAKAPIDFNSAEQKTSSANSERRRASKDMDMFRNMARDINKKK
ncbi:MAG: hypothetical protein ACFB4I_23860 [Cyanophyceae cyanobacterium]